MIKIGAHVSATGGLDRAIERAELIGAETVQIFGSSPRQWRVNQFNQTETKIFQEKIRSSRIKSVYLHAPYLANPASRDQALRRKSVQQLIGHFKISQSLKAKGLIVHLGSGEIELLIKALKEILKSNQGRTWLILENSAGGGEKLGSSLSELKIIFKKINSNRVKFCFDAAHAFEAGLLTDYRIDPIRKFFDQWQKEIGLDNIVVIHANDSKTEANSCHDQHENIGQGKIGLTGFKNLAKEKRLRSKDWILEVPGFDRAGPDRKNIIILRSCFS